MINFDKIDGMMITKPENIRYLSGFTGSSGIMVMLPDEKFLLTDFRYQEQAEKEAPECGIIIIKNGYAESLKKLFAEKSVKTVGFEPEELSYSQYKSFSSVAGEFLPYESFTKDLRLIKTPEEIANIKKAAEIAEDSLLDTLGFIKEGVSEADIACELDYRMRKRGASGNSFETIAVAGVNSSLVHGSPGKYKIQSGDFLLIDFGCVYNGYCSDMTRTFAIGDISKKQKQVYDIVLKAQLAALGKIAPGVKASDIDKVARDIIKDAGYGECFGHALGHGVGLKIHEEPRLSEKSDTVLQPGMVITIEPGIYIEGEFGVRIEDLVVVTDKNYQILCPKTGKEIIYI